MQFIFLYLTSGDGECAGPATVLVVEFVFWTSIDYDSVLRFTLRETRVVNKRRRHSIACTEYLSPR